MRIAYHAYWNIGHQDGVSSKIARQMRYWQGQGHVVRLYALTSNTRPAACFQGLDVRTYPLRSRLDFFKMPLRLLPDLEDFRPDLVYLRYNKYYPPLERLSRLAPVALEINTNDVDEYRITSGLPVYLYHRLTRHLVLKNCDGMVFLSHEVAGRFRAFGKPHAVIGESVSLENYHPAPAPQNVQPRLIFVSSVRGVWHGVDKIAWLAARFPDWIFDIVGLRADSSPAQPPANMIFHGFMGRKNYEAVFAGADVAIGPLALHRINIHENAPLKLREYLAFGLPCITAYLDTDFNQGAPFLLQLPNTESNVQEHSGEIERFVRAWMGRRIPPHSADRLDVSIKEGKRLDFFADLVRQREHSSR